jgi:hypothetical protein
MTMSEFMALCENAAIEGSHPELRENPLLLALWHDHRDHWDTAHTIAQEVPTPAGSAVHAYLHRKEGDLSNAQYWYARAGGHMPSSSLAEEWHALVVQLCTKSS